MEEAEIVFAQKLASGEPITRKRALKALHDWIKNESTKNEFDMESMSRLCKGLHYAMWMQDKMLLQEELADNIASLITHFNTEQQSVLFVQCMLITVSHEWARIDRWRMDKFLMLMRRLLRAVFIDLSSKQWQQSLIDMYMNAFQQCAISSDKKFCEGLKFHFASIFLDELDNAGGLEPERVTKLLEPFAKLLAERKISSYLFDSILQEIFLTILHGYAEEKAAASTQQDDEMTEEGISDERLRFNYGDIAKMLFDIGKSPSVKSDRRKRLYKVSRKFKAAEAGEDPFRMVTKAETRLKAKIPKSDFVNAVSRLLNEKAKDTALKRKARLRKRNAAKVHQQVATTDVIDATSAEVTVKTTPNKKSKSVRKNMRSAKKVKTGGINKRRKSMKKKLK